MTYLCIVGPVSAKWINDGSEVPMAAVQVSLNLVHVQAGKKGEPVIRQDGIITYSIEEGDRFNRSFWEAREGRAALVVAEPYSDDDREEEPTLGSHGVHSVFDLGRG